MSKAVFTEGILAGDDREITLLVPKDIYEGLSGLTSEELGKVREAVLEALVSVSYNAKQETAIQIEKQNILESDEALEELRGKVFGGAIVRASTYKDQSRLIEFGDGPRRLFVGSSKGSMLHFDYNQMDRPVVMLGSFLSLFEKHSWRCGSSSLQKGVTAYLSQLILRYFRRIKYTCFNREQHNNTLDEMRTKLKQCKGLKVWLDHCGLYVDYETYNWREWEVCEGDDRQWVRYCFWLNGRYYDHKDNITWSQHSRLKQLHQVLGKVDGLVDMELNDHG